MPQSLANIWTHLIFSTKDRYAFLTDKTIRQEMHGLSYQTPSAWRTSRAVRNDFVKRTRNHQNTSAASGKRAGINHTADPRHAFGNTFCCPRKKDPVAIKNEKHIRQRCRTMRLAPDTPRKSMRRSPAAASSATEPRKKNIPNIPGGTPLNDLVGFFAAAIPFMNRTIPNANANKRAPHSITLESPFRRLAVNHPVVTR